MSETLPNTCETVEGTFHGVKRVKTLSRPYFVIVGTYDTVRHGMLFDFILAVPEECEMVNLINKYWIRCGNRCWEASISPGDPETPDCGKITELDCKRFERAKSLMMELKGEMYP